MYDNKHFSPEAIRTYEGDKSIQPYNRNYLEERPPFPLLDIFYDVVWELRSRLEQKRKLLVFDIVSILGDMVIGSKIENQDQLEELLRRVGTRDGSLLHMVGDKLFMELVRAVKNEFDTGYKQFLYYH
jgi:hypothetical protein